MSIDAAGDRKIDKENLNSTIKIDEVTYSFEYPEDPSEIVIQFPPPATIESQEEKETFKNHCLEQYNYYNNWYISYYRGEYYHNNAQNYCIDNSQHDHQYPHNEWKTETENNQNNNYTDTDVHYPTQSKNSENSAYDDQNYTYDSEQEREIDEKIENIDFETVGRILGYSVPSKYTQGF